MPDQKSGNKRTRSTSETDGAFVNVTQIAKCNICNDHFEFICYITVFCVQAQIKHEKICDIIKSVLEAPDYSDCTIKIMVYPLI